jgi:hypothetical protein
MIWIKRAVRLTASDGDSAGAPRHNWWNCVASSKERIEAAKEAWRAGDWQHGRFHLPPGDDAEFIRLPGAGGPPRHAAGLRDPRPGEAGAIRGGRLAM